MPHAFAVNTGDTMKRWTNGRFLSTPHRALPPIRYGDWLAQWYMANYDPKAQADTAA